MKETIVIIVISLLSCPKSLAEPVRSYDQDSKNQRVQNRVLNPAQFDGKSQEAYIAAAAHPELMKKLFLYDGSDIANGYTCLLDSFTSTWAADCKLAQEEAIFAAELAKAGHSLPEIQKQVDLRFSQYYPFVVMSSALKQYRKHLSTKTSLL